MKRLFYYLYIGVCVIICVSFLLGCTSTEEVQSDNGDTSETAVEQPGKIDPVIETEKKPEEPEEEETQTENNVSAGTQAYTMGEQEYKQTKKDLSELVDELNRIIANRNYQKWLNYLTKEYKDYYSNPEVLKEYSEAPLLKKYDIKLRSLKDYFNYVVVASRKDVHIDDIKALSENKVRAYMIVDNEPIVVYTLKKVGDRWKITK